MPVKSLLPHLLYLLVLLACGWYFRQSAETSLREIRWLHGATGAITGVIKQPDKQLLERIDLFVARVHYSDRDMKERASLYKAISLLSIPVIGAAHRDTVLSGLKSLIAPKDNPLIHYLDMCLLPLPGGNSDPEFEDLYLRRDTLRRGYARYAVTQYYAERTFGSYCGFWETFDLAFSSSPICPRVGELLQGEIMISVEPAVLPQHLKVNGREISIRLGKGIFKDTFQNPGTYPLNITAEYRVPDRDTLCRLEKTFLLNVNR